MTPAEAQIRAQSELHAGESLLWNGVADARRAAITAIPETILPGILFLGFAITYMYKASSATPKTSSRALSPLLSMLVMGGPFLMFGMINLIRPIWIYWKGLSTVYAVTNQRSVIRRPADCPEFPSLDSDDFHLHFHPEARLCIALSLPLLRRNTARETA